MARHLLIQRRHCRSFPSSRALPWTMIMHSVRREYTTTVKNAIRRTDTLYHLLRYGEAYVQQTEAVYAEQVRERVEKQAAPMSAIKSTPKIASGFAFR